MKNIKCNTVTPYLDIKEIGVITFQEALGLIETHPWEQSDELLEKDEELHPTYIQFLAEKDNNSYLVIYCSNNEFVITVVAVKKPHYFWFLAKEAFFVVSSLNKIQAIEIIEKFFKNDINQFYEWAKPEEKRQRKIEQQVIEEWRREKSSR
jgi:hypothetical protein